MTKKNRIPHKYLPWIDARKKFRLSHAQIQMARELGMNPKRFHSFANTGKDSSKLPLPQYIESLYEKQFGKQSPDVIKTIEEMAAERMEKRAAQKAIRQDESEETTE